MIVVYIIILLLAVWLSVICRLIVLHPFATVYYAIKDVYLYFKYHKYDYLDAGVLNCYSAHFGGGKTLSIVHVIVLLYNRFNNKQVYDREQKRMVTQRVHIISNATLKTVPFEPLVSLSQVVCQAYMNKKIDAQNKTRTVILVLLDEASSQLNSRNFKTNIDPDFLNTLITSRHYHISFFYSSQKFKLTDALLRSVSQKVINCKKVWRFMVQNEYDADEIEYASNPNLVRPIYRTGFFIKDKDYNAYDTLAVVDKLKKSVDEGDMMSEKEILEARGQLNPDNDAITNRSLRMKMRKRR